MATSGIYQIKTINSGKIYIGSSFNIEARKSQHFYRLRKGNHANGHLQATFNKYGESCFEFSIVEKVTEDLLFEREQFWIDFYNSANKMIGYNKAPVAGSTRGIKVSEEMKIHLSVSMKGNTFAKGRKNTPEQAARHLERMKTRVFPESQRKALSERMKGNTHTLGFKHSEKTKAQMSRNMKGIPKSLESRENYRQAAIKREADKRVIIPYVKPDWLIAYEKSKE